jgi:hypothetical protein
MRQRLTAMSIALSGCLHGSRHPVSSIAPNSRGNTDNVEDEDDCPKPEQLPYTVRLVKRNQNRVQRVFRK